jgi:hypothetical protein
MNHKSKQQAGAGVLRLAVPKRKLQKRGISVA